MIRVYRGLRLPDGTAKVEAGKLTANARPPMREVEPLKHLVRHSPDGYNWGYGGSGPSDLARSIIGDTMGTDSPPAHVYQQFKGKVIASFDPTKGWRLTSYEILEFFKREFKYMVEALNCAVCQQAFEAVSRKDGKYECPSCGKPTLHGGDTHAR